MSDPELAPSPDALKPLIDGANAALAREDWDAAIRDAAQIRQFRSHSAGFRIGIQALHRSKRLVEAWALLQATPRDNDGLPWQLIEGATIALERKLWNDALRYSTALRAAAPANPNGYRVAAVALRYNERYCAADRVLAEAQDLFPELVWPWTEAAAVAEEQGDLQRAAERAAEARERHPDNIAAYRIGYRALAQTGDSEAAQAVLDSARALFPADPAPWADAAWVARRSGDVAGALKIWQTVIERFPEHLTRFVGEAAINRALKRYDDAERLLRDAMDRFPQSTLAARDFARTAQERGDWAEADRRWEETKTRFSGDIEIALGHAVVPADSKRRPANWTEALARLSALHQELPSCGEAYQYHIAFLRKTRQLEEAQDVASRAMEGLPEDFGIALENAGIAVDRDDLPGAISCFEKMRVQFAEAPSLIGLAEMLSRAGQVAEAEACTNEALAQFPWLPEVHRAHAGLAARRGDWTEAHRRWLKAKSLFPNHAEITKGLLTAEIDLALADGNEAPPAQPVLPAQEPVETAASLADIATDIEKEPPPAAEATPAAPAEPTTATGGPHILKMLRGLRTRPRRR